MTEIDKATTSGPANPAQPDPRPWLRRVLPLAGLICVAALVFGMGWHRQIAPENLVQHREAIIAFVEANRLAAVGIFMAVYVVAVSLSLPGSWFLTIGGGFLFGTLAGGGAAALAATIGATIIFLIARSAVGEHLIGRAGPTAEKLAQGFRDNAFSYLLFLRLVPAFPFFLVNLVPAVAGVRLRTFVAATAIGILPATYAFAFFGTGLDAAMAEPAAAYRACLAQGRTDCRLDFGVRDVLQPKLLIALLGLCVVALAPIAVKHWTGRKPRT